MIYRAKQKNIIMEFSLAENKTLGTIVLCDGLPSVPKQRNLMQSLSNAGYAVVFPRYEGTWESKGTFLKHPPSKDILAIINLLKKGQLTELYGNKQLHIPTKKLFLLGSSFGGNVALSLSNCSKINKIIALSPIVDFNNANNQNLPRLGNFIKNAFGQGYRFTASNWKKVISGNLLNPIVIKPKDRKKITIFYDKKDKEIDYKQILAFATKYKLKLKMLSGPGHISFSKLGGGLLQNILKELK